MPVDGVNNSNSGANQTQNDDAPARVPKKTLGQEDFFKLIAVQLSSQDPLKPMEDTAFIAQLANFSSLDMMGQLSGNFATFATRQDFAAAQALLGRQVTVLDDSDTEVTGVVSAVRNDDDDTLITVNGADYEVSSVRRVELTSNPTGSD